MKRDCCSLCVHQAVLRAEEEKKAVEKAKTKELLTQKVLKGGDMSEAMKQALQSKVR